MGATSRSCPPRTSNAPARQRVERPPAVASPWRRSTCAIRRQRLPRGSASPPAGRIRTARAPGPRSAATAAPWRSCRKRRTWCGAMGTVRRTSFFTTRRPAATELVSRRPDGRPASGTSRLPAVSADGKTVAFQSLASDLICAKDCASAGRDINLLWDVFVYERSSGLVTRASADETGEWMEPSRAPSLNGDGRVLVFASRHPIDHEDMRHDDDLFVWMRGGN